MVPSPRMHRRYLVQSLGISTIPVPIVSQISGFIVVCGVVVGKVVVVWGGFTVHVSLMHKIFNFIEIPKLLITTFSASYRSPGTHWVPPFGGNIVPVGHSLTVLWNNFKWHEKWSILHRQYTPSQHFPSLLFQKTIYHRIKFYTYKALNIKIASFWIGVRKRACNSKSTDIIDGLTWTWSC